MSRTQSAMVELGTTAPAFELLDVVSGKAMSRDDVFALSCDDDVPAQVSLMPDGSVSKTGRHGLLVMFVCVHCPYVKHVEEELARIGKDYKGRIAIAAVSSNDVLAYPQDGPEEMKQQAERLGWEFPYLFDDSQEVARSYDAACTPDFFLYDAQMKLVYRGQLDGSRPPAISFSGVPSAMTGRGVLAVKSVPTPITCDGSIPDAAMAAGTAFFSTST